MGLLVTILSAESKKGMEKLKSGPQAADIKLTLKPKVWS